MKGKALSCLQWVFLQQTDNRKMLSHLTLLSVAPLLLALVSQAQLFGSPGILSLFVATPCCMGPLLVCR